MIIRKFPDPILRKKAAGVDKVGDAEKSLLSEMAKTMYLASGVGLAAGQVGVDKQIAVIDVGNGLIQLINPVILKREGLVVEEEGCLSVPNTTVKVRRARKVVVAFLKEKGEASRLSAEGLFARAMQHEIDHLKGKIILDYMSPIKRLFLKRAEK